MSGLTTAVLAVLVALFLAPLLADLPKAVLAAMVMVAAIGLLNPAPLHRFARIDRTELWVAVAVALLGLIGGMLLGVAAGIALTLLSVVRHFNQPQVRPLYRRREGGWSTNPPVGAEPGLPPDPDAVVLHLDGVLYTGNAQSTHDAVLAASRPDNRAAALVVLEGATVYGVTVPMIDTISALREELAGQGTRLVLAEFPPSTVQRMRGSRWFREAESAGLMADTVEAALTRPALG